MSLDINERNVEWDCPSTVSSSFLNLQFLFYFNDKSLSKYFFFFKIKTLYATKINETTKKNKQTLDFLKGKTTEMHH